MKNPEEVYQVYKYQEIICFRISYENKRLRQLALWGDALYAWVWLPPTNYFY